MDPFVNLTTESKAVQTIKRTPPDKDGGVDPVWQQEIKFDIVDHNVAISEQRPCDLLDSKWICPLD